MTEIKTVPVTNKAEVAYFLENGVKPLNIFLGDNRTIVFQYNKYDTNALHREFIAKYPKSVSL